jgi:hypothetical protein
MDKWCRKKKIKTMTLLLLARASFMADTTHECTPEEVVAAMSEKRGPVTHGHIAHRALAMLFMNDTITKVGVERLREREKMMEGWQR